MKERGETIKIDTREMTEMIEEEIMTESKSTREEDKEMIIMTEEDTENRTMIGQDTDKETRNMTDQGTDKTIKRITDKISTLPKIPTKSNHGLT